MKTYTDESKQLFWPQFISNPVHIETSKIFFSLISQAASHFLKCQSAFSL